VAESTSAEQAVRAILERTTNEMDTTSRLGGAESASKVLATQWAGVDEALIELARRVDGISSSR
jgi:hypothetical protein